MGGALAAAVLGAVGDSGSLTIIARDLKRSVGYQAASIMKEDAEQRGLGKRFQWLNAGAALEGGRFEKILGALRDAGADRVVYVNTVAAAMPGLLPGCPPVFVKDVDEAGLFEWELTPLDERSIEATKYTMGTMAVELPSVLERNVPIIIMNSLTKPLVPGSPMTENATNTKSAESSGIARARPERSEIRALPYRLEMIPTSKKRAPSEMP